MSLGLDLVPLKVCSMDCVYCEVGKTTRLTTERKEYVPEDKVLSELETFFSTCPNRLNTAPAWKINFNPNLLAD